jgi:nucleotide-binding universal stress UspA family protein
VVTIETLCPMKILLAVDGSRYRDAEAELVAGITWPAGTTTHVLAVVPERLPLIGIGPETQRLVDETLADIRQQERVAAEALAVRVVDRLRAYDLTTEAHVREGRPAEVILEHAEALSADLIVIGARGLSAPGEFRLGATAHRLIHYADCPVLVTRSPVRAQLLSTILATDGSTEAGRAAEFPCALSLPQWAEVTVVSVAEAEGGIVPAIRSDEYHSAANVPAALRQTLLDAAEACLAETVVNLRDCGAQVGGGVRIGHPADEILSAARDQEADMIIVGARGRTSATCFRLGGVAQKVVRYAPCSVLVVR